MLRWLLLPKIICFGALTLRTSQSISSKTLFITEITAPHAVPTVWNGVHFLSPKWVWPPLSHLSTSSGSVVTVLCWYWIQLIFYWPVCLENVISASECSYDMCLVKNGSNMYFGENGTKELIIATITFTSPVWMNTIKTAYSLLKGRDAGETHVTLIQEVIV